MSASFVCVGGTLFLLMTVLLKIMKPFTCLLVLCAQLILTVKSAPLRAVEFEALWNWSSPFAFTLCPQRLHLIYESLETPFLCVLKATILGHP